MKELKQIKEEEMFEDMYIGCKDMQEHFKNVGKKELEEHYKVKAEKEAKIKW